MSRRTHENIIAVGLLVLFAGVVWLCQDFGPRARMIPMPLAIFGIVLTVLQIIWQNTRSMDELQMDMITVTEPVVAQEEPAERPPAPADERPMWLRELSAYAIVAALVLLIFGVGIMPAVFVFAAGYFALSHQYSWLMSLIYSALLTITLYLLFGVALQMQPYHGLLAPLVERFQ